jgi:polyphosphate glucokinase
MRLGKKKWMKHVYYITGVMMAALNPNDVVIGGGNVKNLKELPTGCRAGDNAYAFIGGFRMWEEKYSQSSPKKKNAVK